MIRALVLTLVLCAGLGAVPIRSQQIVSDGFVIDTVQTGRIECHVTAIQQGSQTQVTILKNGVQVGQTTFQSPTTTQVETWVQQQMGSALLVSVPGAQAGTLTVGTMQFFIHVFTFNPFSVAILSANVGEQVPGTWWQQQ